MITWMQRHRKWLVVTIWISTVAFVGAGFVGWGTYDLNLTRSSSVASVGDEKISFFEFNSRFSQVFNYYQQISDGALTEQQAMEQGLDLVALQSLVDDKLLLNYAKELGIGSSEDEIISILLSDREFYDINGSFDKNIYYNLLAQNKISTKDYEQMLADSIALRKLSVLFNLPVKEDEFQMLASNFFMQDVLSIELVRADKNINTSIDEDALNKLWLNHKEDFKTQKYYELSTYFLPIKKETVNEENLRAFYEKNKQNYTDFSGKILSFEQAKNELISSYSLEQIKSEANKAYLALSKKELDFQADKKISDNDVYYPTELFTKANTVLKPFIFEQNGQKGYMIARINSINPARTKTYEEAREELLPLYKSQRQKEALAQKADLALEKFKGKNIGSVARDTQRNEQRVSEDLMNDAEFSFFLMNVFNSNKDKSFVLFDDKAILYKINAQSLLNSAKLEEYKPTLEQNIKNIKANELRKELLAELKKKYKVEIYYERQKS